MAAAVGEEGSRDPWDAGTKEARCTSPTFGRTQTHKSWKDRGTEMSDTKTEVNGERGSTYKQEEGEKKRKDRGTRTERKEQIGGQGGVSQTSESWRVVRILSFICSFIKSVFLEHYWVPGTFWVWVLSRELNRENVCPLGGLYPIEGR